MTLILTNKDGLYADRRIVIHDEIQDADGFGKGTKLFTHPDRLYHVAFTGNIPTDWKLYADSLYGFAMTGWLADPQVKKVELAGELGDSYSELTGVIIRTPWFAAWYDKKRPKELEILNPLRVFARGSTSIAPRLLGMEIREHGKVLHEPIPIADIYHSVSIYDACVSRDFDTGLVSALTKRKPARETIRKMAQLPTIKFAEPTNKPAKKKTKPTKARVTRRKVTK